MAAGAFTACAWYLAKRFEWKQAFAYLSHVDFLKVVGSVCVVHLVYIVLRTWRWQVVVGHANPGVRFFELYWITAIVVSLANVTPGQLGEALKIEVLKRRGLLGRLPGIGGFVVERLMDSLVVATMGAAGLAFGTGMQARYPGLATAVGIVLAAGSIALYAWLRLDRDGPAWRWLAEIRRGSGSPLIWPKMFVLSLASWTFVGLGWQISLLAVGIHISLIEVLWFIALVTLGTLMSFVPAGLGVTEALAYASLAHMGVADVAAQAGAMMMRVYGLIIVGFGLFHWALWLLYSRFGGRAPAGAAE
jgi:uncharacterized membrane protein YbhN (UPF0104 family)